MFNPINPLHHGISRAILPHMTSWSRHPGNSPELCMECGERPPDKPRRLCKPCRSRQVQERKKAALATPLGVCTVDGCDEPRATARGQRRSKCITHYTEHKRELDAQRRRKLGKPERIVSRPPSGTVIPEGSKWCSICSEVKPITEFSGSKGKKDGRQSKCKACDYVMYQRRLAGDPERVRALNRERTKRNIKMHLYGVTREEYEAAVAAQGNCCAICCRKAKLHIDHSHFLGHNRGLLCNTCNPGIGLFRDDPALLRAAADYLEADIERALSPGPLPKLPIALRAPDLADAVVQQVTQGGDSGAEHDRDDGDHSDHQDERGDDDGDEDAGGDHPASVA